VRKRVADVRIPHGRVGIVDDAILVAVGPQDVRRTEQFPPIGIIAAFTVPSSKLK
jgi:hypothetical protein